MDCCDAQTLPSGKLRGAGRVYSWEHAHTRPERKKRYKHLGEDIVGALGIPGVNSED